MPCIQRWKSKLKRRGAGLQAPLLDEPVGVRLINTHYSRYEHRRFHYLLMFVQESNSGEIRRPTAKTVFRTETRQDFAAGSEPIDRRSDPMPPRIGFVLRVFERPAVPPQRSPNRGEQFSHPHGLWRKSDFGIFGSVPASKVACLPTLERKPAIKRNHRRISQTRHICGSSESPLNRDCGDSF